MNERHNEPVSIKPFELTDGEAKILLEFTKIKETYYTEQMKLAESKGVSNKTVSRSFIILRKYNLIKLLRKDKPKKNKRGVAIGHTQDIHTITLPGLITALGYFDEIWEDIENVMEIHEDLLPLIFGKRDRFRVKLGKKGINSQSFEKYKNAFPWKKESNLTVLDVLLASLRTHFISRFNRSLFWRQALHYAVSPEEQNRLYEEEWERAKIYHPELSNDEKSAFTDFVTFRHLDTLLIMDWNSEIYLDTFFHWGPHNSDFTPPQNFYKILFIIAKNDNDLSKFFEDSIDLRLYEAEANLNEAKQIDEVWKRGEGEITYASQNIFQRKIGSMIAELKKNVSSYGGSQDPK